MIINLQKLKAGDSALVHDIEGGRGVRRRFSHLGIHPGDTVKVIRKGFFGGPVLIEIHGMEVGIGQGMAEKLVVEVEEGECG
jgi:ferrous iron transport protein A